MDTSRSRAMRSMVSAIIGGTLTQPAEDVDFNIVDAVRDNLVRISADLFAFNVARGWDLGLGRSIRSARIWRLRAIHM